MTTKANLPVTLPKQGKQVISRVRKAKPTSKRTSATMSISCGCGCGEILTPDRSTQKFLPGHRFTSYETHRCPTCQVVHRVSKEGMKK